MTLAAILYDLDGTLANTDPIHFQAWQESLTPFDLSIDETFYKRQISGRLNPDIVADLLPHLTPQASQIFIDGKESRFRELALHLTPLAGLHSVIDWAIAHRLKQAVVTNAPSENARFMLKALKLDHVFDHLVLSEELAAGKPDPIPYQQSLQLFGLEANQVIAFEDSPSGVRSAVAAGILTIGIASTQDPADLAAVGATIVVPDFTALELWGLLEDFNYKNG